MKSLSKNAYEQMALVGRALGSPARLKMMNFLMQAERSVEELANMIEHSAPNTSAHLKALQSAGLVTRRRERRRVYYRLAEGPALRLWLTLRDMGLTESATMREEMAAVPDNDTVMRTLDAESLLNGVSRGELTLLDLRPAEEYAAGHIPSSKSVPFGELEKRLSELDPNSTIVAYCRGPFCFAAIQSIKLLTERGYDAVRMYGGIGDWIEEGFPVEVTKTQRPDNEHAATS